ncbi:unnamed protein product [Diabrotica balteata]|uniref:Uncharacterized protein n=1 Tax=Diabrotica balteata TaxID=107213 RepID=A0A9N9XA21_DIABA|nr:unnamed protein product [Diabrotica balteata]
MSKSSTPMEDCWGIMLHVEILTSILMEENRNQVVELT